MTPRIHLERALHRGEVFALPPAQARHAQVLRLQPGDALVLFNGGGGEWRAAIERMGRSEVEVRVEAHVAVERELARRVTLAVGMPANERMDLLIEKATELGIAAIQPLLCERSVLRLAGERADKRRQHWQGVAIAAAEQSGRTRVPEVAAVLSLRPWLQTLGPGAAPDAAGEPARYLLSLQGRRLSRSSLRAGASGPWLFLSGPEGGLTGDEEAAAGLCGFVAVSLGERVLRADTAPLAILAWCALAAQFEDH